MTLYLKYIFLVVCILMTGTELRGQPERLEVPKIDQDIEFDGLPFESVWEQVTPLPMVMFQPTFGLEPSEKTEVRLFFNDAYLYISARLFDSHPENIQNTTKKRDEFSSNSDGFGIILDSFNDKENGLGFSTTPSGLRTDIHIIKDANAGFNQMPFNIDWNTFWDVKTVINDQGWFVEMRIPISSLRFQNIDGQVVMGLTAWRWIPHKNESLIFPAIDPKFGAFAMLKPSEAREVIFTGMQPKKPVYLTPYVLTGWKESNHLNDAKTNYIYTSDPIFKIGGELKYGLTSNLTLDLTVNTDFAQVEVDDQQVNLTRFSLFFPEKRQFFQERSSNFDFNLGGPNNLFYSRRIGLHKGKEVRIYGGTRLVGRVGGWDIGFLNMQTARLTGTSDMEIPADSVLLPSENFGVIRMRRQVINQYSYVGGMMTSRLGADGTYNIAYGLDGIFRIFGDDYVDIKWAQTFENNASNNALSLAPSRFRVSWQRRRSEKLGYSFSYSHSGSEFNPGVGFEIRDNYTNLRGNILWGWLPDENSKLYSHQVYIRGSYLARVEDGSVESVDIGPGWKFQTKSFFEGDFRISRLIEDVDRIFDFSDSAWIPIGRYEFWSSRIMLSTPMTRPASLRMEVESGQFYDGTRISLRFTPNWSVSSSLGLSGYYEFNRLDFNDRKQHFIAHIGRIKVLYMLSVKFSLSAFLQYSSAVNSVSSNIRFRYNPREGNDLYIVFNEGRNTNLQRKVPPLPAFSNRSVMLKYTYTFQF